MNHTNTTSKRGVTPKKTLLLAAILMTAAPLVFSEDWPQWRGPNRDGIAPDTTWRPESLSGGPRIQWETTVGVGFSSVAVSGGYLFTMGNTKAYDTIYCIDVDTGRTVWTYTYECSSGQYPGPRATPTVDGDRVYTLSREGHLYCFQIDKGDVVWKRHLTKDYGARPPEWDFAGSPVVVGDRIVINAGRSGLAVDKLTGAELWTSGRSAGGYATPVIYEHDGRTAAAIFGSSSIYGVDISDGTVLWSYPWSNTVNGADPVVSNKVVMVAGAYGKGSALIDFSSTPRPVWQSRVFQTHFSSFVLIDGFVYGNDGDARRPTSGVFRSVELATGKTMWEADLGFGSIIASKGRLIMLSSIGVIHVAAASPEGYREIAKAALPRNQYWTPPALVDGLLFCRNLRGDLFCIDLR